MPSIANKEALITAIQDGLQPKYLFFWGHQPQVDHRIDKSCLSQWYEASFTINQITYPTAEHYMMAEKARLFEDEANLQKILLAQHPGEAKKLGRAVQNFDGSRWEAHRFEIVVQGNSAKFSQNQALKTFLFNTKNRILVEASPNDAIWGIGLSQDDAQASQPEQWAGLNLLGFALMTVRANLAEETYA